MRVNPIIRSNNDVYRNLNSEYKSKHEDNDKNDISFYDVLEKAILYRKTNKNLFHKDYRCNVMTERTREKNGKI